MQKKLSIEELKSVPETLLYPLKSRYVETKKRTGLSETRCRWRSLTRLIMTTPGLTCTPSPR